MSHQSYDLINNLNSNKIVKLSIKYFQYLDDSLFTSLVIALKNYLESGTFIDSNFMSQLKSNLTKLEKNQMNQLVHGMFILIKYSLRSPNYIKSDTYKNLLLNEYKIESNLADILVNQIFNSSSKKIVPIGPNLPSCKELKWRIDVIISSSCLSKIMEPLIVFNLITNENKLIKFECKLVKFNQLRLLIAIILKEFHRLEKKIDFKNLKMF